MNIFSLIRINSLPLNSRKNENYEENGKFSRIKSILFLILHMISNFHSIWTANINTKVSHRKENLIENSNQLIFF